MSLGCSISRRSFFVRIQLGGFMYRWTLTSKISIHTSEDQGYRFFVGKAKRFAIKIVVLIRLFSFIKFLFLIRLFSYIKFLFSFTRCYLEGLLFCWNPCRPFVIDVRLRSTFFLQCSLVSLIESKVLFHWAVLLWTAYRCLWVCAMNSKTFFTSFPPAGDIVGIFAKHTFSDFMTKVDEN